MKTHFTLRSANPDDAGAIRTCIAAAYADAISELGDLPDVTSGIEEDIAQRIVIVAENQSECAGVIICGSVDRDMMIFNLAVAPGYQGHGVARHLIKHAAETARDAACTRMVLNTHSQMHATVAMYRHLGWQVSAAVGKKITMCKVL